MTPELVKEVFQLNCQIVLDPISGTPLCAPIGRKHQAKPYASNGGMSLATMLTNNQPVLTTAG